MQRKILLSLAMFSCLLVSSLPGLEVYTINQGVQYYSLDILRQTRQESFTTKRFKHEQNLVETWEGLSLQKWLEERNYTDFQSIRFESADNYMVRIHKAELDSMPGYLVLKKDGKWLDSTEVRVIFPAQRDMFWVRGVARIYLEDFQPAPPPRQIFVWDSISKKLSLQHHPKPFIKIEGFSFDNVMRSVFYQDTGSVILVSRDGIKQRLEYPKHLKGAVLEVTEDGAINLKSPVIPAGMWLKDVVFVQCGPYSVVKYDFLYRLPYLDQLLDWKTFSDDKMVTRSAASKARVSLESLYQPDAKPFEPDEWIELK
jgi:hypothetical protein